MRFWDASAVVPLLAAQASTPRCLELLAEDSAVVAWWGTAVECRSALARLRREGVILQDGEEAAVGLLTMMRESWLEIAPSEAVREQALRLLGLHALRAGDALQLAAALIAAGSAASLDFITLDERLRGAARLEGFAVV